MKIHQENIREYHNIRKHFLSWTIPVIWYIVGWNNWRPKLHHNVLWFLSPIISGQKYIYNKSNTSVYTPDCARLYETEDIVSLANCYNFESACLATVVCCGSQVCKMSFNNYSWILHNSHILFYQNVCSSYWYSSFSGM